MKRIFAALVLAIGATFLLSACSPTSEPIEVKPETTIIDVRTPAEFATGHLENALNMDVQSETFDTLVEALPKDREYLVYCRSGNRSGQAVERMKSMGFTDLTNIGSVQEASNVTGIAIVQ